MDHCIAVDDCDHSYETRLLGGHPLHVRLCIICRKPDWSDLMEQALSLYRWGREEGLAGKPPRETLSAYDRPSEDAALEIEDRSRTNPDAGQARTLLAEILGQFTAVRPEHDPTGEVVEHRCRVLPYEMDRWREALKGGGPAEPDATEKLIKALARIRDVHRPASDWSWKPLGCQHDGAHDAPCRGCHGECWPCPTIRAIDAEKAGE